MFLVSLNTVLAFCFMASGGSVAYISVITLLRIITLNESYSISIHLSGGFFLKLCMTDLACAAISCLPIEENMLTSECILICFNAVCFRFCFLTLLLVHLLAAKPPSLSSSLLLHTFCYHWTTASVMRMKMRYDRQNCSVCHRYLRDWAERIKRGRVGSCVYIFWFFLLAAYQSFHRDTVGYNTILLLSGWPETNLISQLFLLIAATLSYWFGSPFKACLPLALWHLFFIFIPFLFSSKLFFCWSIYTSSTWTGEWLMNMARDNDVPPL